MFLKVVSRTLFFLVLLLLLNHGYSQQVNSTRKIVHVKLKANASALLPSEVLRTSTNGYAQTGHPGIDALNAKHQVVSMRRIFRPSGKYEYAHQRFGLDRWYEVTFESASEAAIIQDYRTIQEFEKVEHVEPYHHIGAKAERSLLSTLPSPANDPLFSSQWHYKNTGQSGGTPGADIALTQAWSIESGSDDVIVAVIDGGIDTAHPDLTGAMWINEDEIPANSIDDDGNGYVDDIYGYGFGDNTGTIFGDYHGTHVGGTIGAVTNNGVGVAGVAGGSGSGDGVRLMSCAGFGNVGVGGFEDAMVYAADNGAVISQNSWGGGSSAIEDAIDYFIARAGLDNTAANFDDNIQIGPMAGGLVIFAAGNSNSSSPSSGYPGSYEPVMAVASTDHNDVRSSFSNFGSWVEIAAPGSSVYSTYPVSLGSYATLSGTSMACPHVSGVAALIISKYGGPGLMPDQVRDRLMETADNIDAQNPSYIGQLGAGRLNALNALQSDDGIAPAAITDLDVADEDLTSVTLTWTAPGGSGMDGAASVYEIRYSTSLINETNFASATLVTGVPSPLVAGSTETFEVDGLAPLTTYHFAIKSSDFFGNKSSLSNVISGSTPPPPVIGVTPEELTEALLTGASSTQYLTVSNTGASDLDFTVTSTSQSISAVVVARTASPAERPVTVQRTSIPYYTQQPPKQKTGEQEVQHLRSKGTASPTPATSGRLFILSDTSNEIQELDGADGTVIASIPLPEPLSAGPDGLAFDGTYLYFTNNFGTGKIYRLDPTDGTVVGELTLSTTYDIDGLAHSGEYLYALNYATGTILEVDFDLGTVQRTISSSTVFGGSLTFGGTRGTLFASDFSGNIHEVDLASGNVINSFSTGSYIYGLGYSEGLGILFAANTSTNTLQSFDPDDGAVLNSWSGIYSAAVATDEIGGPAWLTPDNSLLSVAPGQSVQVAVQFNANGLNGGTYNRQLVIESNDPVTPEVVVPVTLTVTGAPNLIAFPASMDFEETFIGASKTLNLDISNNGTDDLLVTNIVSDDAVFSPSLTSFTLNPGESETIVIEYSPTATISTSTQLHIHSNDPDLAILDIPLAGVGVTPPVIAVDPTSLVENLFTGEQATQQLSISNTGGSDLQWEIKGEDFVDPASVKIGYQLKAIALEANEANDGQRMETRVIEALNVALLDLDETTIGYMLGSASTLQSDLVARGATIQTVTFPLSSSALSTLNIFAVDDQIALASGSDIALLRTWIESGGSLLLTADNSTSMSQVNALLTDTGISETSISFADGVFSDIEIHPTTTDVASIAASAYGSYCTITAPAAVLIHESSTRVHAAVSSLGLGKVIAVGNEFADDFHTGSSDNRLFANQVFDWLAVNTPWLSAPVSTGTIAAGTSEEIDIVFDATGLFGGTYSANLAISSNDPINPDLTIPVTLHVTGAPDLTVPVSEIIFPNTFVGGVSEIDLILHNEGTEVLDISSIESSLPVFSASVSTLSLDPGESETIVIAFSPAAAGAVSGELTIASNDQGEPTITIDLSGTGVEPPVIEVTPSAISSSLLTGATEVHELTISNTGTTPLNWSASLSIPGGSAVSVSTAGVGPNNDGVVVPAAANNPLYPMAFGDFTSRAASPVPLTSLAVDPASSFIYGQANAGTAFYRYDPVANSWTSLQSAPVSSGNNGGATILNGKVYTTYTDHTQMGVYDISANTWTTITSTQSTGNITSDGVYIYTLVGTSLQRYNPTTNSWSSLASPAVSFSKWGALQFHNGYIYGQTGNGSSALARYQISSNTWTTLTGAPGGMVLGGAIDPVDKVFYAYGSYGGNTLYAYSIESGTWSIRTIPSFFVNDGGLLFVGKSQLQGIYFTQGEAGTGFSRFETKPLVQWLAIDPVVGTVAPGQSEVIEVTLDSHGLGSATYEATIELANNDPTQPVVEVPVSLTVTGAPDIRASDVALSFVPHFIGVSTTASITLHNDGVDPLLVSSIVSNNTSFTVGSFSPSIAPGESASFNLTFSPLVTGLLSGTLQIASNDPDENPLVISFTGTGVAPPEMSVNRAAVNKTMVVDAESTEQIQLINEGDSPLIWELEVTGTGGPTGLNNVLTTLNANYGTITSLITSKFDFAGGESGSYIDDGGNDMYDGGNMLGTNLGSNLNYSNKMITSSATLGTGGSYFTAKYPGLFVLAADVANLSHFETTGNLGADGSGSVDGAVLTTTKNGVAFKGFVKRVYNAFDPSVNHLIIVRDQGSVSHSFSSDTNSDLHTVSNLSGVTRIYYLLFAGTSGAYINNDAMREVMVAFLNLVDEGAPWLSISTEGGTLAANTSQNINLTFNTEDLELGDYSATLTFTGNDPATPSIEVPIDLEVAALINNPPVAGTAIANKTVEVGDHLQINLAAHFSDPESQALTFSAAIANTSAVGHTLVGSLLDISGLSAGTSGVTITAKDPHLASASSSFTVTVVPANESPIITSPVQPQVVEVGSVLSFPLANIFSDPENDVLTFVVVSSVPTAAGAVIESGVLKVNGLAVGVSFITVQATDTHNQSVSMIFKVEVQPANLPPLVTKAMEEITVEVGEVKTVNLAAHFTDPEGFSLSYTATADKAEPANFSVAGSLLALTGINEGDATISVTAKDQRLATTTTAFKLNVVAANLPPMAIKPLDDITLVVGESVTLPLGDYFSDPEAGLLTYDVGFTTVGGVLGTLTGGALTLKGIALGETILQLEVTDPKGLKVQSEATVLVVAPDLPPVLKGELQDMALVAGDPEETIDLSDYFSDPEGSSLTYVVSYSGEKILATTNDEMLTVSGKAEGETVVAITAKDPGENEANASFTVTVRVNHAPMVAAPFAPIGLKVTDEPLELNLATGFIDEDSDPLTYSLVSPASSAVTGEVDGAVLRITPVSVGTTELHVKASDSRGLFASLVIAVTVNPVTGLENAGHVDLNFPSPFSHELFIQYAVTSPGHVQLAMYDQQGRKVALLTDEWKPGGTHTARWDASMQSAGFYYYKLTIGSSQIFRKVIKNK